MLEIVPIRDPGLGNTSYLVDVGDGSGLVVDPQRDPRPYLEAARRHRLVIRHVAETHLHADFVSGARELVALGATLLAPRRADLAHPHRPVGEGDEIPAGDLTLRVIDTPGHTPEHVAYLLCEQTRPLVLFSGGTLLVGGVARPDLISSDLTGPLARSAYGSVRRLLTDLPDDVEIRPTHGGGSFCSPAGVSRSDATTVGLEKRNHPAVTAPDADAFVSDLLSGLGTYPRYFRRLREVNQVGPRIFGVDLPRLRPLGVEEAAEATVVDARPIDRFAQGHIPGSVSIELRDQFGTWLGWLFEPDHPLVFVLDPDQEERELVRQALTVGHERLVGRIGLDDWTAAGRPLGTVDLIPAELIPYDTKILDVRQHSEWEEGHVSGAVHIELGELVFGTHQVPPGVVVHCGHGQRAMTAASLLARAGNPPAAVTLGDHLEITRVLGAA